MNPISLCCLDMAGTTVTDGGLVERCFAAAMVASGATGRDEAADLQMVRDTMGQEKIVVFRRLFAGDESIAQRANIGFERAGISAVADGVVPAIPGAARALAVMRDRGIRICLTTGFAPSTREAIVAAIGWGDLVDLSLSPADAGRGRPWPDMIWAAAMRLGIDGADEIAVVGDTANDLLAGRRSGASVVTGVLTGAHDRAALTAAPHTHILDSVTDLPAVLAEENAMRGTKVQVERVDDLPSGLR